MVRMKGGKELKPDAKIFLTMKPNGAFLMEIHDPIGKRFIFSDPTDPYKTAYSNMEKAISQTIQVILRSKETKDHEPSI